MALRGTVEGTVIDTGVLALNSMDELAVSRFSDEQKLGAELLLHLVSRMRMGASGVNVAVPDGSQVG